jgi:hypothetical protein
MPHRVAFLLISLAAMMTARGSQSSLRSLQQQDHLGGAGCSFRIAGSAATAAAVFQWDFAREAWINISGVDVRLKRVRSRETPIRKHRISVGDRRIVEFAGAGLKVFVETRVTSVCPENNESCEVWSEDGIIRVVAGGESSRTRVTGSCGS